MSEASEVSKAGARGLRNDRISGLLLFVFALVVAWQNRAYPLGTLAEPGPGYMPLALAIFIGAMGLLIAAWGGQSAPFRAAAWPEFTRAVVILAACVVAALAFERFGYRLTVMALLIFLIGVVERKHWMLAAGVAIGFSFASYFVFATWLKVPLPASPWGL